MTKIMKNECLVARMLSYIILLLNAALTVYWGELIWREDGCMALEWVFREGRFSLCAVFFVFWVECGLFLLTNRIFLSLTLTDVTFYGLTLINYFKYDLKGEVFQFSDLSLYKEALSVVGEFTLRFSPYLIAGLIFCTVRLVFLWQCAKLAKVRPDKRIRIGEAVTGAVICLATFWMIPWAYSRVDDTPVIYTAATYYKEVGVMGGFFKTLPRKPERPQDYGKLAVEHVLDDVPVPEESKVRPDVIFIMEESLSDIAALDGVKLSSDPLARLKEYQGNYTSGKILSPTYGGNTCQVEFEVLTGYPAYNMPGNAYTDYIHAYTDSLVSLYKNHGYETYAYHPNTGSFFNRNYVYHSMGFDHISFKDDFELQLSGISGWTDDASLFQNVIYDYENRDEGEPFFAFVVTTQNHGGYDWDFPDEKYITVESAVQEGEEYERALETYANLCKYSDIALDELIQYFEQQDEPVIIVIWGDHAPSYGFFGGAYDGSDGELKNHTTPLLIWDNYDLPRQELGYLSAYRLGAWVAQMSGVADPWCSLLASEDCPNAIYSLQVTTDGHFTERTECSEESEAFLNRIWLIEYDRLFGNNYYEDIIKERGYGN